MAELDLDPRIFTSPYTTRLAGYDSMSLLDKKRITVELKDVAWFILKTIFPYMKNPQKAVKSGFGLPLYIDILLLTSKTTPFTSGGSADIAEVFNSYIRTIENLYNGKKIDFAVSSKFALRDEGKAAAIIADWIMHVFYPYVWGEHIRKKVNETNRPITAAEKAAFKDAVASFYKPESALTRLQASILSRGNHREGLIFPTSWQYNEYVKGVFWVSAKEYSDTYITGTRMKPTVLGAMVAALPPMLIPDPLKGTGDPSQAIFAVGGARPTGSTNPRFYSIRKLFGGMGAYALSVDKVEEGIMRLKSQAKATLAKIDQRIRETIQQTAIASAGQVAEDAGILDLETTPFYQKPVFTVAVAGAIFIIGYTILKR